MEAKTIKLNTPLKSKPTLEVADIVEVTLKMPKVKHLKNVALGKIDSMGEGVKWISAFSGIPALALEELDFSDYKNIMEETINFLEEAGLTAQKIATN